MQDTDKSGKPSDSVSTSIARYLDEVFSSIPAGLYANTSLLQRVTSEMGHHHSILRLCSSHHQASNKSRSSIMQWLSSLLQVYTQLSVSLLILAVALNVVYTVSGERRQSSIVVASLVTAVVSSPFYALVSVLFGVIDRSSDELSECKESDARAEIIRFMQSSNLLATTNAPGLMDQAKNTAYITSIAHAAVSKAIWYRNNVLSGLKRRDFDADWCLVPSGCDDIEDYETAVMAKKLSFLQGVMSGLSNEVEHKLSLAGKRAQVVHRSLMYKSPHEVGSCLLRRLVLDVLENSGGNEVGKVFALKVGYEDAMRHSSGICSKIICAILLLMLNACCVVGCVYLLSGFIYEDPVIPTQDWMIASALYFVQHAVVYETLAVFVVHVAIPSMVQQSIVAVRNILSNLLKQVVQGSGYLDEKQHEEFLSAQEYFYVSRIVSHAFPSVFESQVVSAYNSPWLRNEALHRVVTVNLPRQTGGSVCCGIHSSLWYIGSSYPLLVQHSLMYALFSSIPTGVVILVYYLSTDSAVIIAAVFIQLLLLLFVLVVYFTSLVRGITPSDLLADHVDYTVKEANTEDEKGFIADGTSQAIDEYYGDSDEKVDINYDGYDDPDAIRPAEMTSPEDGQDDIGAYEFAVDDERDVDGAIVRVTKDVSAKAKNLSAKAYRLKFTSPFKINIAENMAAEYSAKPDRGMTPDKTLAKREAVEKTYLSPLDRTTTPGNGVVRVGEYISPLSRGTSPDKGTRAGTANGNNMSPLNRSTSPDKGTRTGTANRNYMSPLKRSTSPDNRVAKVSSGKSKSPDSSKKSKK